MADNGILRSFGLETVKRKYCEAGKVEAALAALSDRAERLEKENRALREQTGELSRGREEIGEAFLSARTVARQLVADARREADETLAAAREEAERLVAEAKERADALVAEAEEKSSSLLAGSGEKEQKTVRSVQDCYLDMRGRLESMTRELDGAWQRFLCSLGDDPLPETPDVLPADLSEKLGAIAESLAAIDAEDE